MPAQQASIDTAYHAALAYHYDGTTLEGCLAEARASFTRVARHFSAGPTMNGLIVE